MTIDEAKKKLKDNIKEINNAGFTVLVDILDLDSDGCYHLEEIFSDQISIVPKID